MRAWLTETTSPPANNWRSGTQIFEALIDHDMEETGGKPERSDLMAANGLPQLFEGRLMGRHDDELGAMQECTPDLERGGVKGDRRQLQPAFVRTEASEVGIVHETNDVLVHHTDAFGLTGRAGGEHDIGEMRRVHVERGVITWLRGDAFPVLIQTEQVGLRRWQVVEQVGLGEQHRNGGIFEHEGETFGGIGRVKRQVSTASFENAEDADDHLQRAFDTDADQDLWSHAKGARGGGPIGWRGC